MLLWNCGGCLLGAGTEFIYRESSQSESPYRVTFYQQHTKWPNSLLHFKFVCKLTCFLRVVILKLEGRPEGFHFVRLKNLALPQVSLLQQCRCWRFLIVISNLLSILFLRSPIDVGTLDFLAPLTHPYISKQVLPKSPESTHAQQAFIISYLNCVHITTTLKPHSSHSLRSRTRKQRATVTSGRWLYTKISHELINSSLLFCRHRTVLFRIW